MDQVGHATANEGQGNLVLSFRPKLFSDFWEEKKWDDMMYELGGKANSAYHSWKVAENP